MRVRWPALLIALVVGLGAGVIGAVLVPTTYSAKATLFVSSPAAASSKVPAQHATIRALSPLPHGPR